MDFNEVPEDANDHQSIFSKSLENGQTIINSKANKSLKTNFLVYFGAHEFFSIEMWKATFTELIATACFLLTLTISIISCLESHESESKILVPFAIFIIAFFFLLTTIPLSGGHLNPIFSLIATLRGITTFVRAIFYMLAQCIGAVIAYTIIKSVMNKNVAKKYSLGGCVINNGNGERVTLITAFLLEFSCTFIVLFVGVTVGFDKRRFKELGLCMVCAILAASYGLAVFVSISVTGSSGYGGVGLNPARCLGSALLHGGVLWNGHWVFWVGPFLACIVYHGYTLTLPKEGMGSVDQ